MCYDKFAWGFFLLLFAISVTWITDQHLKLDGLEKMRNIINLLNWTCSRKILCVEKIESMLLTMRFFFSVNTYLRIYVMDWFFVLFGFSSLRWLLICTWMEYTINFTLYFNLSLGSFRKGKKEASHDAQFSVGWIDR